MYARLRSIMLVFPCYISLMVLYMYAATLTWFTEVLYWHDAQVCIGTYMTTDKNDKYYNFMILY